MANEFIIKNGFHSKGDSQVTGSLDVSGAIFSNGSQLGAPFPFTGDAEITGSLIISGSFNAFTLDSDNIVLGSGSGVVMQESANNNVILGTNTADSLTTGDQNVAIGHQALQALTGNSGNTAIGFEAAKAYTNSNSIFIGYRAGLAWSTGNDNVVIGKEAADAHTSGGTNVYIGYSAAGGGVGGGSYNLAIGANSGKNLSTGTNNVALGKNAGLNLNQGTENIAIGTNALDSIAGGEYNIAIGYYAGASLDQDDGNIMIGFGSAADGTTNGELKIGSGSITTIHGNLATGDLTFPSTASAEYFAGNGSQLTNLPSSGVQSITVDSGIIDTGNASIPSLGVRYTTTVEDNNIIDGASTGTVVATTDTILYNDLDAGGNVAKKIAISELPFTNNAGTITSVTGTAPVASSGGTTPVISMAAASTSANGYLTSTDWDTFNNKTSNVGTVTKTGTPTEYAIPAWTNASNITTSVFQIIGNLLKINTSVSKGMSFANSDDGDSTFLSIPANDTVVLKNTTANGTVAINANTSTAGTGGDTQVALFSSTF